MYNNIFIYLDRKRIKIINYTSELLLKNIIQLIKSKNNNYIFKKSVKCLLNYIPNQIYKKFELKQLIMGNFSCSNVFINQVKEMKLIVL